MSEKYSDHPVWKLSALMASEWPAKIREQVLKLVEDTENNPAIEAHHYAGFWLPSIDFAEETFTKPVYFNHAVFLQDVGFSQTTFSESANFAHAAFKGRADFLSMSFDAPADFEWARFEQDVLFSDAHFADEAVFCDAFIERDLVFEGETFGGEADFRTAKILKDGNLVFDRTDLRYSRFGGLNLDRVNFRGVEWYRPTGNRWTKSRNVLWDEFRPVEINGKKRDFVQIADCYRQLVLNCERRRDFESAEDFHIGEMEIRRGAEESRIRKPLLAWLWKQINAYALYWRFSRYGTSYRLAFVWLLLWVVVVFPVAYMFSGFHVVDTETGRFAGTIEYRTLLDFRHIEHWLPDWLKAANFSLSIATFQRTRLFEASGELTHFFSAIESVVVAAQSALALFAIRRRFKR